MAKFCSKCGKELNESGKCPSCDSGKDFFSTPGRDDLGGGTLKETPVSKPKPTPTSEPKKEKKPEKKAEKVAPTPELTKKEKRFLKKQEKKREKKAKKKESWNAMSFGEKTKRIFLVFLIWILLIFFVSVGVVGVLTYFDVIDIPVVTKLMSQMGLERKTEEGQTATAEPGNGGEPSDVDVDDPGEIIDVDPYADIEYPDVEQYYADNASVISKTNVADSGQIQTEAQAYSNFVDRGFVDCEIFTNYDMSGEYVETVIISENSSTEHPAYQTYYLTESGNLWSLMEINGILVANPAFYNLKSGKVPVMIAETDTVYSYDCVVNVFYETVPNEATMIIKKVEKIDAETLNSLTEGEINAL